MFQGYAAMQEHLSGQVQEIFFFLSLKFICKFTFGLSVKYGRRYFITDSFRRRFPRTSVHTKVGQICATDSQGFRFGLPKISETDPKISKGEQKPQQRWHKRIRLVNAFLS